ncbi:MAG: bifunctional UDP-N-acetylglucosamine diphosphorylase/glucosamine-1-phosphate N-acetyltransferase GlmU [Chloroflexi bacterium]|nr:bifunctional UDP-N-acetylglucosamine diphosphorylase/glucosamine-1-phosphate N-acetyltransferase GlmU [Chloroflexota bacterium]
MAEIGAVVLAAGLGTRMKSNTIKVLHPLVGRPMVCHVLDALLPLGIAKIVLVVGRDGASVRQAVPNTVEFVEQREQLGTGHAVMQARSALEGHAEHVVVLYGDAPLVRSETLLRLMDLHLNTKSTVTSLTVLRDDPTGYGRIIRVAGEVKRIVEEQSASVEERQIREVNGGLYCFESSWLWKHLPLLQISEKGEYYLTDLIATAAAEGRAVQTMVADDPLEAMGVNDRVQLAEAEAVLGWRIRRQLMRSGVTLVDPSHTYIDGGVDIGQDTVVYPGTFIKGKTKIGDRCVIGPNSYVVDSAVGSDCQIFASVVEGAEMEDGVIVGPFSHLRPGAYLAKGVHLGNFAEVKNSSLGQDTKVHHFSYVGDATVGSRVNIAAGTITCNFDAETGQKHRTIIEDDVALGSDTMLVAPVRVARGAETGAGSVVTKDIPPDSLALGVPARVVRKVKGPRGS